MSNLSALEKILWTINDDSKVDSSSIIEKLKSELQQHHVNMHNAWEESGFDINSNSFDGSNLLCLASGSGCVKVVEFLVEKEADVNVRDNDGKTPLHLAVIIPGQNTYIAKVLLDKGAEINIQDNEGKTPLHLAASYVVSSFWGTQETKDENVKMLLDRGAEVNIQDNEGRTPLHLAVSTPGQSIQIAEMLLNKGAEVDIQDKEGKTPLGYAISNGREEVIEILTGRILLSDEGLKSQMLSEQEVEIDSQDQYETLPSYPFFF